MCVRFEHSRYLPIYVINDRMPCRPALRHIPYCNIESNAPVYTVYTSHDRTSSPRKVKKLARLATSAFRSGDTDERRFCFNVRMPMRCNECGVRDDDESSESREEESARGTAQRNTAQRGTADEAYRDEVRRDKVRRDKVRRDKVRRDEALLTRRPVVSRRR